MNLDLVRNVANAVLYEGYILYPYRASAIKNRQRFNFGALVPRSFCDEQSAKNGTSSRSVEHTPGRAENPDLSPFSPRGGSETWTMRTECLIEGEQPVIDVRVRFLHLVSREVYRLLNADGAPRYEPTASLEVAGKSYHTWQEAVEREETAENLRVQDLFHRPQRFEFAFGPSEMSESLCDADHQAVGKLVRRQELVRGSFTISAKPQPDGLTKLCVALNNITQVAADCSSRGEALMHSLASTHTILAARAGEFVSLLDPPSSFAESASACANVGTWPVLVGEAGQRDMMLSSPIILYDYPQVAPESDGDFFDSMEIDEMLALRVMTLTEDERREMQSVDDRARQILERTEALPPEHWRKLHGAIRGMKTIS